MHARLHAILTKPKCGKADDMTATNTLSLEEGRIYRETGALPARMQTAADKKIAEKAKRNVKACEKVLQDRCEMWLYHRGYMRLTAENADAVGIEGDDIKGWYGHLHAAKRNPLMPDIFLFDCDMDRCLMVELKVRPVYQPGQEEMIALGAWEEVYDFESFEIAVLAWETHTTIDAREALSA